MDEPIDPNQIKSGPIRHDFLSPEVIGPYLGMTLEKLELSLMRDLA